MLLQKGIVRGLQVYDHVLLDPELFETPIPENFAEERCIIRGLYANISGQRTDKGIFSLGATIINLGDFKFTGQ